MQKCIFRNDEKWFSCYFWPIKLAGVHFMVIMSDQRINSCFFVKKFFRQILIFSVQTRPNSFIFEPNRNTIVRMCFSTQFFPLNLILKSKMIQGDIQKSCFVSLDLPFHQMGHIWPLLGMFTQDILKYSVEIVVRLIFRNFWTFYFLRPNSSKLIYFWTKNKINIYGCFFYSIFPTDFKSGTVLPFHWIIENLLFLRKGQ